MYYALITAGLVAASSAAILPRDTCCFGLSSSGGVSGQLGQLSDGQNRVTDGEKLDNPDAQYCIAANGAITDGMGRGCILTPPTTQFQCDKGASPTPGFSVDSNGELQYKGDSTFYACPADTGVYNFYTEPVANQPKCVKVMLSTGGKCAAPKPSPPPAPKPSPTATAKTCATTLTGSYETPHLIVPVNKASPDMAYGTSYFGEVSSSISTIFNFDIPASDKGKTCTVVFMFPEQKDLVTSSYTISGSGDVGFCMLESPATQMTTYNNAPKASHEYGWKHVMPGNSYVVATGDCQAGERIAYEMSASGDLDLNYFQDWNPAAIGLYITVC